MKKIILLIVSVWMCVSCGNLEEMNIDPDNATQTHPKLLLTQICMNAFKRGTDGMYATKKVIQADGESADQYYKWTRGSFGYYDNLRNVQKMGEEADISKENESCGDGKRHPRSKPQRRQRWVAG
jgi:hypothetical protein